MEQILKISNALEKIGQQRVKIGKYRFSKYNYIVCTDGYYLVYNLFSRGMILLTAEEYDNFSKSISIESSSTVNELTSFLIENYYLIPEKFDEQSVYLDFYDLIRVLDNKPDITSYTVLTTTACNARCFYCFEKDFIPVSMTRKTALDLSSYMMKHSGGKKTSIHWFGGEPLCNTAAIDIISQELEAAGYAFSSSITSNGYAFNEEIIMRAKERWHTEFVQITLDGMDEEHNRRKAFTVEGANPFRRIIKNIHLLLDNGITVSIRINLDQNNIESVRALLSFLTKEFECEKNIVIYIAKIFDDCGAWKIERTKLEKEKLNQSYEEFSRFLFASKRLRIKAVNNGFKYYHCGSNNKHHRTISPEGRFLACHNLSATLSYGSIYQGITDDNVFNQWIGCRTINSKCDGCTLLPECTTFSQCPNIKQNCVEDTKNRLNRAIVERYSRYLNKAL